MSKKKSRVMILILTLAIILSMGAFSACSNDQQDPNGGDDKLGEPNNERLDVEDLTEIPFDQMDLPEIIAVINGQEIDKAQFLKDYAQMKMLYESVGIDTATPQVIEFMNEAIVSDMITTTLMSQEADNKGITVDDSRVQEEFEKSVALFPTEQEFFDKLEELNIEEESFREKLRRQLKIADLMKEWVREVDELKGKGKLTDEELKDLYEMIDAQLGGTTSFEDLQETAEEMIEYNKAQIVIGERIQALIDNGEVDLFI